MSQDDKIDVKTIIISDIKLLRFRVSLQSFSSIDQPIIFQVDIGQNTFEPVEDNRYEQCNDIDDIIPTNNLVDILHQQMNGLEKTSNDFSIHDTKYNNRLMTQKYHDSILSWESDVAVSLNSEDKVYDSSDDESFHIDSDSSSSDNDYWAWVVTISNVNLRELGPSKSAVYNVYYMITAVEINHQQELGFVWLLTEEKSSIERLPIVRTLR